MNSRIVRAWIVSFAIAGAVALIGVAAHPDLWGMYIQLPGIAVGMFIGWTAQRGSQILLNTLVIGTTVVLNAVCYFYLSKLFVWMMSRTTSSRGRVQT